MTEYRNPPTVVVVLIPMDEGLVLVRRGLPDGLGKLAIPGGFQEYPDSLREAGAREVLEETGIVLDPESLTLIDAVTVPDGSVNLIFFESPEQPATNRFHHDGEVQEVVIAYGPIETAFPLHTKQVSDFFARSALSAV